MLRLLAVALVATATTAMPAQAATIPVTVMTENIAGSTINRGEVTKRAATVVAKVKQYKPTTFTAQEVCYSQYVAIRRQLLRRGYSTAFTTTTGHHCRGAYGDRFGNVVAVKGKVLRKTIVKLPTPSPGEPRSLLCVDAKIRARPVKVCTTHFSPYDPDRTVQADHVRGLMGGYVKGSVVFSGDLNLYTARRPLQAFRSVFPDPGMYTGGPTAMSHAGQPHKIDHTFWTGTLTDSATYADPLSDHRGVVAHGLLK